MFGKSSFPCPFLTCPLSLFPFQMVTRTKKIFVGGLSAQSTLEDVKNYFEQFGKVRNRDRRGGENGKMELF